ncbi:nitrile hydratase accessory protein [Thioclava sp. GXIMD2076]|uniref:Nitrile hydratase accessory protein n=1 Tax=Thioclava kandeliae TaxID=3070818 RepID=A0ABV1SDY1_9RHOB
MEIVSIIQALDPCRTDLKSLGAQDLGAPGFGEPWHAQVFGLSMALAQAGVFSWATWVETFSTEIRANPQTGTETSEDAYYRQWSAALVTLLRKTGVMTDEELAETSEHWRRSYIATEHGKPIVFRRDLPDLPDIDGHHHHHHHHPEPVPVAISEKA